MLLIRQKFHVFLLQLVSILAIQDVLVLEQYTITLSGPYATFLKLIGTSESQRQSAKRGHSITYFHNAPQEISSAQKTLPRLTGIQNFLTTSFLGSQKYGEPSILGSVPQLQVRPNVIYPWLNVLKAINPLYKDIEIINYEECREALLNIPADLIENATIMKDLVHQDIAEVIELRTARPRPVP